MIIQFGYNGNVSYNTDIYFPITYTAYTRVIPVLVDDIRGYTVFALGTVQNNYFTPYRKGTSGETYGGNWMWVSIGY